MAIDLDTELDTEPLPPDPEPEASAHTPRGYCKVCGSKAASKRGYYCEEHRQPRGPKPGVKADKAPKAPREPAPVKAGLKAELVTTFRTLGSIWAMTGPRIAPSDMPLLLPDFPPEMVKDLVHPGQALINQSETLASSLIDACSGSPRMTKWLEAAAQPSGVLSVGIAVVPIVGSARVWYTTVTPRYREVVANMQAQAEANAQEMPPQEAGNNGVAA